MDLHPPNLTGQAYNVISMKYTQFNQFTQFDHPIRPVEFDQHLSQWIYTQFKFDQAGIQCNLNDYTQFKFNQSNLTGHKLLVKLGGNSLRLYCMPP